MKILLTLISLSLILLSCDSNTSDYSVYIISSDSVRIESHITGHTYLGSSDAEYIKYFMNRDYTIKQEP